MAKGTKQLGREEIISLIDYDPINGVFRWKVNHPMSSRNGGLAGSIDYQGYRRIIISGRGYRAHHIAWLITTGCWPKDQIDHINGKKADNRIVNLREATNTENNRNKGIRKDNHSGFKGVSKMGKKWKAELKHGKTRIYLGLYLTPEEAHNAYAKKAIELRGEFARTRGFDG
ncbi:MULTISPECIES: HNH endonuclease [Pantoea]|jgi:hypothetical protein|uniref:HNH endonuclease n=1 Tax=Pantoea brenneri TaxID=472694 RepID=A0A7Y6NFX8_9GAMM|nr:MULTISPECIES: HNH endonuclease [Pantoea]MBZ6396554.1 HNH endonuclease [Pantoea sp.]MBZ6438371.1 HNH endonuclease [Pantoea sp.]NUY42784.1 HNH endonuclease [Pantoea brenneri]NUY50413.1 HNH endonuclease [Pantoea brenneri]NUY60683.1 HNH endonuclease [Pantoea brenneri]